MTQTQIDAAKANYLATAAKAAAALEVRCAAVDAFAAAAAALVLIISADALPPVPPARKNL